MKLREAEIRLQTLVGKNLNQIAKDFNVSLYGPKGSLKKGWVEDIVETYTAGSKSNKIEKVFEDTELKLVPISINSKNNSVAVKSYLSICVITEDELLKKTFSKSSLYRNISSLLVGLYAQDIKNKDSAVFLGVKTFKLGGKLLKIVKDDYALLRKFVKNEGLDSVSGSPSVPCKFFNMKSKNLKGKPRRVFTINPKDVLEHILSLSNYEYKKLQSLALTVHR
ncbi:MAG: MutH/Sau3AI family endonuclease [Thermodesulfobacteriota bacterium]